MMQRSWNFVLGAILSICLFSSFTPPTLAAEPTPTVVHRPVLEVFSDLNLDPRQSYGALVIK